MALRNLDYLPSNRPMDVLNESILQNLTQSDREMIELFQNNWDSLGILDTYQIYAFTVHRRGIYDYVGVLAEKNGEKKVYSFKGIHKELMRRIYYNRKNLTDLFRLIPYPHVDPVILINEGDSFNWIRPKDDQDLIFHREGGPLFQFTTNGLRQYKGNKYTNIENINFFLPININDYNSVKFILMDNLKHDNIDLNNRDDVFCSLDELENGTRVVVALGEINNEDNNMRKRYLLQLKGIEGTFFISNYWLEEEMDSLNLQFVFIIELKEMRVTPENTNERFLSCSQFIS